MRDLIRKIIKEETNKNFTNLIQRLMDRNIVSKYNHITDRDLAKNIMDDVWTTINKYFEISPKLRSAFVRNCEEDTTDLFEAEITERCWKGYTQKGMKTMFGKRYPNCVKIKK